jgi:hypothetical protein
MKYFRCTNKKDPEEIFYTYSSSDATTVEDVSRILILEDYQIEECSQEEFERETAEEDPKAEALQLLDEIRNMVCGYADGASCSNPPSQEDLEELEAKLSELNRKIEAI